MFFLSIIALILAFSAALFFFINIRLYLPLEAQHISLEDNRLGVFPEISVLIPARNEEKNIVGAIEAVLANSDVNFELLILDDHSEDATRKLVEQLAVKDRRIKLISSPPLPTGWCGKQHACYQLAKSASKPRLLFIDADVRLGHQALAQMARFQHQSGATIISGIPKQITKSFLERLLLPLIHFVLLAYLPIWTMRRSKNPAFGAGCGQLFFTTALAYHQMGGHAMIKGSLHDGIALPKAYREAGLTTDLFDATGSASCKMYDSNLEVWRGLSKNAVEGMATPKRIIPFTLLLGGGQVLPLVLLIVSVTRSGPVLSLALLAVIFSYYPRIVASQRFDQPLLSAILHPIGVLLLLVLQWTALIKSWFGRPSFWKGRHYNLEA
jgi:hypothetical protein